MAGGRFPHRSFVGRANEKNMQQLHARPSEVNAHLIRHRFRKWQDYKVTTTLYQRECVIKMTATKRRTTRRRGKLRRRRRRRRRRKKKERTRKKKRIEEEFAMSQTSWFILHPPGPSGLPRTWREGRQNGGKMQSRCLAVCWYKSAG